MAAWTALACGTALATPSLAAGRSFARQAATIVRAYASRNRFSGTVLVARDGRVLFARAYGKADLAWNVPNRVDTKFEIASLSKAFTAMAVVQLAAAGKLDVRDAISKYYADAPQSWKNITIDELLTHTSGLPNNAIQDFPKGIAVPYTMDELIATFRDRPLRFAPGTDWGYTNTEYYLLAYVIERVSGATYADYLARHIFRPLGMNDTGFAPTTAVVDRLAEGYAREGQQFRLRDYFDRSLEIGAGGLHSSVRDLLRWDSALYTEKLAPRQFIDRVFAASNKGSYGYGWFVTEDRGQKRIWHEGSDPGYAAFVVRRPAQHLFVIVLSNIEDSAVREIASELEVAALGRRRDTHTRPD